VLVVGVVLVVLVLAVVVVLAGMHLHLHFCPMHCFGKISLVHSPFWQVPLGHSFSQFSGRVQAPSNSPALRRSSTLPRATLCVLNLVGVLWVMRHIFTLLLGQVSLRRTRFVLPLHRHWFFSPSGHVTGLQVPTH
jgi:hypothetical protein